MANVAAVSNEEAAELRHEFDRLKTDLRDLRTTLSDISSNAVRTAKAGAAVAKHRLDDTVHSAGAKGKEQIEALEEHVAAHPLMSLGIALGVGMVLGFGLTRRG